MTQADKVSTAAKKDLAAAWNKCLNAEKRGAEFGRKCYEWQTKLQKHGVSIRRIWRELKIPRQTADRWIQVYLERVGLKPMKNGPDRAKTNADIINALTSRIEGLQEAILKIESDWEGWAQTCPKETAALSLAIKTAGEYLISLEAKTNE